MAQTRKSAKSKKSTNQPTPGRAGRPASSKGGEPAAVEQPVVAMVHKLAAIVEEHSLTELIYDTPELTLTLRRQGSVAPAAITMPQVVHAPAAAPASLPAAAPPPAPAAAASEASADESLHVITSPFVGTFYRRPSPDAEPYAEMGRRIEKGHVLCIIEAMKLMNEIESDVSGVIAAVLVDDSKPVEYGQPLFKIRPA